MRYNQDPCMKEFGISVSGEFEKVPARVLDPPQLQYQNQKAFVKRGVWKPTKFLRPSELIKDDFSWTILNLDNRTRDDVLYGIVQSLRVNGKDLLFLIHL